MKIEKNIIYRDVEGYAACFNSLDIYFESLRQGEEQRPVAVFIHGGNWSGGDKECFNSTQGAMLPDWFVAQGYVFVAINFRLAGGGHNHDFSIPDMADDIAKALKWLTINGRRYGGRRTGFTLVGYSSGAHLAALTFADKHYLRAYRMLPSDVRAIIAMDVPHFDVPRALEVLQTQDVGLPYQSRRLATLRALFGKSRATQERLSPVTHLDRSMTGTAFLLLSAGHYQGQPQTFSQLMNQHFLSHLQGLGLDACHVHFELCDHTDFLVRFQGEISECVANFLVRTRDLIELLQT